MELKWNGHLCEHLGHQYDYFADMQSLLSVLYQFYVPALILGLTFDSGTESGFPFVFDVRVGVLDVAMDLERPTVQVYFKAC